jgi:hypothetical protein
MAKLDLSQLNNTPRKGINLPDSEIQKVISSHEKKEAQKRELDKKVKYLDKVIAKTDKLIEKHNKKKTKEITSRLQPTVKVTTNRLQKKCAVSKIDYLCLKKFPREMMDILVQKSVLKGSYLECVIDVQEIKELTGEKSKTVRDAFYRLKKRGFFLEVHFSSNGMRIIQLKSDIYF